MANKGVYAAASAMLVESRQLDITARNIAHATTTGYRRESFLRSDFASELALRGKQGDIKGDGGAGVLSAGSTFDFSPGTRIDTGAALDLAISGDGFYRVRDPQGNVRLTRAGHFTLDAQGRIATPDGWLVEGQSGAITIPKDATRMNVHRDGRVSVEGVENGTRTDTVLDQLRIVQVERPSAMRPVNGQYFDPDGQAMRDAVGSEVHQGQLEMANVEPIRELTELIAVQRRYDAAQKALSEQAKGAQLSDMLRGG